jgi:hypothetical protein
MALTFFTTVPKALRLPTSLNTVSRNVAVTPDGTTVVQYLVYVARVVFCIDAGQFAAPDSMQLTPLVVSFVVSVVVVRSARLAIRSRLVFGFAEFTHTSAGVVVKMTVDCGDRSLRMRQRWRLVLDCFTG